MKFVVVFAAVLAVAAAQFPFPSANRFQARYPTASPTPFPYVTSPRPPRPTAAPVVNRVASSDAAASVISEENDINPDGSFRYGFTNDNGIAVEAQGVPRDLGGNPPSVPVVISGSYSYTSPEGYPVVITYSADENGFQAQGDTIPTPHPIPEAILKSLEFIARNPPAPQKK